MVPMELVSPAGSLPALKAAVENGADAVYTGFRDGTNARSFAGLNFNERGLERGLALARERGVRVFVALNTFAQAGQTARWERAVDRALDLGVDALIAADPAVLYYAARHPRAPRLHLSVQASATTADALRFYHEAFGIRRAVLPRVLSARQVAALAEDSPVELEVFGFGSLCIMAEGRCLLSSYATGESPNTHGVCSPAAHVRWSEHGGTREARLAGVLIDRHGPDEPAGYPTLCKGRFRVGGTLDHAIEEPTSLNTLALLPQLQAMGVRAVKIEGRQRSPAYVAQVTSVWRQAIDALERQGPLPEEPAWTRTLAALSEGSQTTLGAYDRGWQ